MEALPRATALIVIDVQQGFDDPRYGHRNNSGVEENIARLLAAWRRTGRPIVHVRHHSREPNSPLRPGQLGADFKELARPWTGEPVVTKQVNSAFIGTDLEERLRGQGIATLVIAGLTTDHGVSTTARMAGNLGFRTYLVSDATATFDRLGPDGQRHLAEAVQAITLAGLHGEFATVVGTDAMIRHADEPPPAASADGPIPASRSPQDAPWP